MKTNAHVACYDINIITVTFSHSVIKRLADNAFYRISLDFLLVYYNILHVKRPTLELVSKAFCYLVTFKLYFK